MGGGVGGGIHGIKTGEAQGGGRVGGIHGIKTGQARGGGEGGPALIEYTPT